MNMSGFFKSTWFKCVAVLLAISAVSGGILTLFNDIFYVSAEERTDRAVKKIYGEVREYSVVLDVDAGDEPFTDEMGFGRIDKVYTVGDEASGTYDLLFNSTGFGGYKNGTVTLWIQVGVTAANDGNLKKINKVILESYEKQTLMSKLGGDFYAFFTLADVTDEILDGKYFTSDEDDNTNIKNPVSNATKSAAAVCNAVNCVIEFVWGQNI